jgi:hypothetical protein
MRGLSTTCAAGCRGAGTVPVSISAMPPLVPPRADPAALTADRTAGAAGAAAANLAGPLGATIARTIKDSSVATVRRCSQRVRPLCITGRPGVTGCNQVTPQRQPSGRSRTGVTRCGYRSDHGPGPATGAGTCEDRHGRLSPCASRRVSRSLRRVGQSFFEWADSSSGSGWVGLLIQAAAGRSAGSGCLRTNRCGLRV